LGLVFVLLVLLVVYLLSSTGAELETAMRTNFLESLKELELFGICGAFVEDGLRLSELVS
jgi:hypothetical protein